MPVRKTQKGANLRRWFKEKWTDEKGNPCGSRKNKSVKKCRPSRRISGKTVKTWSEMSASEKRKAVAEKKRVGMGKRTSQIRRKRKNAKKKRS
ncbi:MAG: hypothetical protein GOVbin15_72 [Prokaryotic dsDNA virus sp.]|nr:MAG: hypothetical protein GOVbin15_72 [Prokaryotic dsDNA virus sp.]|tara:strand:- start:408 stop:686 length:279 start_codon:yes stop_codon:yes gene_type:complete